MTNEERKYTKLETFRYERKFKPSSLSYHQVKNVVLSSAAFFRNIYQPRYVNNIYFDTPELDAFFDNIGGKSDRKKYRIRWYGDLMGTVKGAVFEIKIKSAYRGTKKSFFLNDFDLNENISTAGLRELIKTSNVPQEIYDEIAGLEIKLMNRYRREYFRDLTGVFRLTIDSEIEYMKLGEIFNRFNDSFSDPDSVVEIKYDEEYNEIAASVINSLPFRMTRNSKFVDGIAMFYEVSL